MPWIVALAFPSGDKIVSLFELGDQRRNLVGIVLQICIHGDDNVTFNIGKGHGECCALAIVPSESDRAKARISIVQTIDHFERRIRRSIVNKHHVPPSRCNSVEHGLELTGEFAERLFFVQQRNYHADARIGANVITLLTPSSLIAIASLPVVLPERRATASLSPTIVWLLR